MPLRKYELENIRAAKLEKQKDEPKAAAVQWGAQGGGLYTDVMPPPGKKGPPRPVMTWGSNPGCDVAEEYFRQQESGIVISAEVLFEAIERRKEWRQ
jgi:hypothetical protein